MIITLCDDDQKELDKYHKLIAKIGEKHGFHLSVKKFTNGEDLLFHIKDKDTLIPDAFFLDINMPEIKGTELAQKLLEMNITAPIVFLTASKKHLFDAFDLGAFNYIVKTKNTERRLEKVLLALYEKNKKEKAKEDCITPAKSGEKVIIPLNEILFFKSNNRILTVCYGEKFFEFYSTLEQMEEKLKEKDFIRIHRSYLISVKEVTAYNRTTCTLSNGEVLPVGRRYYDKLRRAFESQI